MTKYFRKMSVAAITVAAVLGFDLDRASAQTSQGTVRAWGANYDGELGNGTTSLVGTPLPVQVSGLGNTVGVAAGYLHSLAVKSDGTVWAWGYNGDGQLGNGTNINSTVPVQVSNLSSVVSVSGGTRHSLALRSDGTVWAWGDNGWGQLGNGTNVGSLVPVQVSSLGNVVRVAAGDLYSMALKSDGTVWAWGADCCGQLGNGTLNMSSTVPSLVLGLANIASIAAGGANGFALKADGTVWGWGDNGASQMGGATSSIVATVPVQVPGLANITTIAAGYGHGLAVKSDGTVWGWGSTTYGQLGIPPTATLASGVIQVPGLANVVAVGAGNIHSLALKSDGTVWDWGGAQGGNNGSIYIPNSVPARLSLTGVTPIALGGGPTALHSLVIVTPAAPATPFNSSFAKLTITAGPPPAFDLKDSFTLGALSNGINPTNEDVTFQVGTYSVTIPAGSFHVVPNSAYVFSGVINGVSLAVQIAPVGVNSFDFKVTANGVNLAGLANPIGIILSIGDDSGSTTANATFN